MKKQSAIAASRAWRTGKVGQGIGDRGDRVAPVVCSAHPVRLAEA
jgi:hypothetical protein